METINSALAKEALANGKKVTAILKGGKPRELVLEGDEVEVIGFITLKERPTHERSVEVNAEYLEINDPKWLETKWFTNSGANVFTIH